MIYYFRLLLGSSSWYQGAVEKYTKGTGSYNKYHRGRLDGTLIIKNISYAEAGKYECVVNSAVGTIYAHSEGNNIKMTKRLIKVIRKQSVSEIEYFYFICFCSYRTWQARKARRRVSNKFRFSVWKGHMDRRYDLRQFNNRLPY